MPTYQRISSMKKLSKVCAAALPKTARNPVPSPKMLEALLLRVCWLAFVLYVVARVSVVRAAGSGRVAAAMGQASSLLAGGEPPEKWGPKHWRKLHKQAETRGLTLDWLFRWLADIPCMECRGFAVAYVLAFPPRDPDQDGKWAIVLHDVVNTKLGKKLFTFVNCSIT